MRTVSKNIDEYIAGFPAGTRELLEQIRTIIRKEAPFAEEKISYAIPTFTVNGRYLIYFAGFKRHVSVYPAPRNQRGFRKELAAYKGGKGTVQFPLGQPLPVDLIRRIVGFRLKQSALAGNVRSARDTRRSKKSTKRDP